MNNIGNVTHVESQTCSLLGMLHGYAHLRKSGFTALQASNRTVSDIDSQLQRHDSFSQDGDVSPGLDESARSL